MSIKVRHLTKIFGAQRAVDDVTFAVEPGQVLGFLGPNGAGKSTTMKILTCFMPPTVGEAYVCGKDVVDAPMEVRKLIGYLPENNPLYLDMYVKEYLAFVARVYKLGKKAKARVDEMIELTGLSAEVRKQIGQLSKGYRQRVGLAQALIHDPEVLVLDEPTSGLDPNQLAEIRALIRQMGREKTVILSTHIMQEVQAICDRVIIINKGRIVADDTTDQLRRKAENKVVVIVEFKERIDAASLERIEGVTKAEAIGARRFSLSSDGAKDLREEAFQFAMQNNLTLLHLQKDEYSLEEVFKELTVEGQSVPAN